MSRLAGQCKEDRLAIAIESGIQNTGIAIFILRFALAQPQADLTTVVPVAVAIMTPIPLLAFWICLKVRAWYVIAQYPAGELLLNNICLSTASTIEEKNGTHLWALRNRVPHQRLIPVRLLTQMHESHQVDVGDETTMLSV